MAKRENEVEKYLKNEVAWKLEGTSRKWVSPGVDGVMDQIVFIPERSKTFLSWHAIQHYVEVKTTDGRLTKWQEREADRLREVGAIVTCVYGKAGVDAYIDDVLVGREIQQEYR